MSVATPCQSHDHVVQFYEDDAFLVEVVTDYLKAGAEAGERLLVLLTPPHLAAVLQRLEASGLDTGAALASGQLVARDARTMLQAIMRDGMPDESLFQEHLLGEIVAWAPLPTRAFGELVNLLCAEGNHQAAVLLEAYWHAACHRMPLTLLCSYALRHFEAAQDAFESICEHHSHVLPAEHYSRLAPRQQLREVSRLQQQALSLRREHASRLQAEATLEAVQASSDAMLRDLADHALHDGVTGLTTRRYAQRRLAAFIADPCPTGKAAVLHIDIDQLKAINDALGLEMGDYFLHETAQRIKRCLGSRAVVSRLSSDEMVAVLPGFASTEALWPILERLLDWTSSPVELDGQQVFTSCCIGVSLFPDHGDSVQALMRHANLARRRAQQLGRRRYQLFSTALLDDTDPAPLALLSALREALPRGEIELYYRPWISAQGGQVVAVSVNPRWHSSRFGDIGQERWMSAAEAAGDVAAIYRWLLSSACRHARAWFDAGVELRVVVTVSSAELQGEGLVERVAEALSRSGLPGRVLELELTESGLMRAPRRSEDILEQLKALGVRLTVDQFGNGQTLLGQFNNGCPFDSLKLDERFISGCLDNPGHQAIIRSAIVLAQGLGMAVVASGVANRAQADYLRHQGCDLLAGSLWSRMEYHETAAEGIGRGG